MNGQQINENVSLVPLLLMLLSDFSRVRLLVTPWTAAYQAPPSMGFSRQEYWSGVPLPSPLGGSNCSVSTFRIPTISSRFLLKMYSFSTKTIQCK